MGPLDAFIHLLSFFAPALAVGGLVALSSRPWQSGQSQTSSLWRQFAMNSIVGGLVLVAGLVYWGADGKMATYAALAVSIATCQWVSGRAWRP